MRISSTRLLLRRFMVGFIVTAVVLLVVIRLTQEEDDPGAPAEPGSVGWLVERHDCWTGYAPHGMRDRLPGHAVVTWPGADGPVYGGARAVQAALAHVLEGKRPDLVVHAFCP